MEEAIVLTRRSARCQDAVCAAEDVLHPLRFLVKVAIVPLDDAQGVYPQVADIEGPSCGDSIPESSRQLIRRNRLLEFRELPTLPTWVLPQRTKSRMFLLVTPWVRESNVSLPVECLFPGFQKAKPGGQGSPDIY